MRKIIIILITVFLSLFLLNVGYSIWSHNTDVSFNLTISPLKDDDKGFDCCICGTYDTIEEGLTILEDLQYYRIHNWMDEFEAQLNGRIKELEAMSIGDITEEEIENEVKRYREDIIGRDMGGCITIYGNHCLERIKELYNDLPYKDKEKITDFWKRYDGIWILSEKLWARREKLYTVVDRLEKAGQDKVDWGNQ